MRRASMIGTFLRRGGLPAATLLLALAVGALAGAGKASADDLPPARVVLERAIEAAGGREAQLAVKHRTGEGTFSVPSQGISGTLFMRASAPDLMVVEIEIPGLGIVRTGYDGKTAWSVNPVTGPMILEGSDLDQMREEADFHAGLDPENDYTAMKNLGIVDFEGRRCYELELTRPSGRTYREYYDLESMLPAGRVGPQSTPMGTVDVTSVVLAYTDVEGVKIATSMKQTTLGIDEVIEITSMHFAPVEEAVYALPGEIQVLVEEPAREGGN